MQKELEKDIAVTSSGVPLSATKEKDHEVDEAE
jgi:hypothetical protein